MSKTFKDSPQPLRGVDPHPLFQIEEGEDYVVKALTAIEEQRVADGTPHTAGSGSAVSPTGIAFFESIMYKSSTEKSLDVAAIIKSFMEADDEPEDIKKTK